jgi:hypothetical protein
MSEIQGHKSTEISLPDRIKEEYPSFIIEIAGEPISECQNHPKFLRNYPGVIHTMQRAVFLDRTPGSFRLQI